MIENMKISITEYLQTQKNDSIKNILNSLESSGNPDKVRKVVLDELNRFYLNACKALTYIQEHNENCN
jgi:hypothetical protein